MTPLDVFQQLQANQGKALVAKCVEYSGKLGLVTNQSLQDGNRLAGFLTVFCPYLLRQGFNVQAGYKVQSLSEFLGSKAPAVATVPDFPAWDDKAAIGNNFIAYLNFLLGHVSPDSTEKALWEKFAPIGIAPGKAFEFDKLSPEQQKAITAGIKSTEEKIKTRMATLKLAGHTQADYNHDWLKRAAVTQLGWAPMTRKKLLIRTFRRMETAIHWTQARVTTP